MTPKQGPEIGAKPHKVAEANFDSHEELKKGRMVGDPGIEPGVGLPGGVTVRCRTLQPVAHPARGIQSGAGGVNGLSGLFYHQRVFFVTLPKRPH